MHRWRDITLGDLAAGLARYRPFIVAVVGVLLVSAFLPGKANKPLANLAGSRGPGGAAATSTTVAAATSSTVAGGTAATGAGGSAGRSGSGAGSSAGGPIVGGSGPLAANQMGPDCDAATGRIKLPTKFAPPCKPPFSGDNGGATYAGVSKDAINVVVYIPQNSAGTQAALEAAGAADSNPNTEQTFKDYFDVFAHHIETYGRKVNVIIEEASGTQDDDAAGRSDAIKAAVQYHAFAVLQAPSGTLAFTDELAARGVECICTTTLPQSYYLQHAPYVWSTLMDEGEAYIQRAEYIGKRLNGKKAQWAGDATLQAKNRVFGLLWYDTSDHAYDAGEKFFVQELAKYNVTLKDTFSFTGANIDPSVTQQQATTQIAKMASDGVTSVIFVGDPLSPAVYTSEATHQQYHPEWVVTGSALTDTDLFGRTYDPTQWMHAFGISFLGAHADPKLSDAYRLYQWHFGGSASPPAANTYPVLYAPVWILMTGIDLAGPNLNPSTFRDGLFNYPLTGIGGITTNAVSFGRHGLWPWDDYMAYDDTTEIWWDPQASGPDEVGHNGVGMYEFVDGGKRYLAGQWPATTPKAFVPAGAVSYYSTLPASDTPPNYPHTNYH